MKKSVCLLLALVILLFNFTAFADGEPETAYTTENDPFEYSEFRIYMSAKVSQKANESYVFVTSLYDKENMLSLDYCVKPAKTDTTVFDTYLTLPEDISNISLNLIVLRRNTDGLSLVNKASYSFGGENTLNLVPENSEGVSQSKYPQSFGIISAENLKIAETRNQDIAFSGAYTTSYLPDGRAFSCEFDFFRVKKRKPLDIPHVATPVQKPLDSVLNIVYNGEYMYSLLPPVFEKDSVYLPVQSALNALGFKFSFEDGKLIGTKDTEKIILSRGSNKVVYNDKTYRLKKAVKNDNTEMVSLTELAKIVGKECTYNPAENVCVIKDKEASK